MRAGVAQPIEIAFEGTTLPGYFASGSGGPDLPPAGSDAEWRRGSIDGRRPLVISVGGYDSTAEESYFWNAAAATARGYHCVMFDGPGQGSLLIERGEPFRPDWELTCDKDYIRFTAAEGTGGHCESGARSLVHERVFDWLDHQLSA